MKRIALLVVAVILAIGLLYVNQAISAQSQQVSMEAELAPQVLNFVGKGEKSLSEVRYPIFSDIQGDNKECIVNLENLSGTYISGEPSYEQCLTTGAITIDPKYRKSGRILVSWNLRVVAEKLPVYNIWKDPPTEPWECDPWHGSVKQQFTGGNAYSQLFVEAAGLRSQPPGNTITMTIPDAGAAIDVVNLIDPTHTGSIVITPDMFKSGELPAKVTFNLKWKNDTSLKLITKDKMRSIVVTITRN